MRQRVGNIEFERKGGKLVLNVFVDGKWHWDLLSKDTAETRRIALAIGHQAGCAHSVVRDV